MVIGSGAAGITAALAAAGQGRRVLLVTKELAGGATPLAQGGLAAAIGPDDDPACHAEDTIAAGGGLCEQGAVEALAAAAPAAIERLVRLGASLDRSALRREGGHHRRRVVHAGDATGAEVYRVLAAALAASRVAVLDRTVALGLLTGPDGVSGLRAGAIAADGTLTKETIEARAVILAAGGLGQAFATTTSPPGATGDGLALAARAGAVLRDPEFVQFHPTVLWRRGATGQRPLITEALRGAGAVLTDLAGRPVMAGRHPLGDLAPRDVVSAVLGERIAGGEPHLLLDATGVGRQQLERGFPTVTAACRNEGVDPVTEPIPVAPGAHYSCGGVLADLDGRTTVPGLFAVGEVASTGVHGANRLASNSVIEAIVAGERAGRAASAGLAGADPAGPLRVPAGTSWFEADLPATVPAAAREELAAAMSRYAGLARDGYGLETMIRVLEKTAGAGGKARRVRDIATVEATNLHATCWLIAAAALARAESRGCHRRLDAPGPAPAGRHTLLRLAGR